MANRFGEVNDVHALIHQIVGAGSMCWKNIELDCPSIDLGEFDMGEASKIADEGFEQLCKIASGLIGDMAADSQAHISEVLDSLGINSKNEGPQGLSPFKC